MGTAQWLGYAMIAVALWGVVGLLQKLGTNRVSSPSLLVWLTVGFVVLVPVFVLRGRWTSPGPEVLAYGLLGGLTNGLGAWCLFAALEKGAKATVAIPMTALYPLVTVLFAVLLLGEALTARQWLGVAVAVVAGGMLSYETTGAAAEGDTGRV
jgi:transporter family protein